MRKMACSLVMAGMIATTALAQESAKSGPPAPNASGTDAPAAAPQTSPDTPAPKRVAVVAGLDFASAYLFRGIKQEDSGVIIPPYVDVGVTVFQGDGALNSVTLNGGNWNSLHSGPTGNSGKGNAWYEADWYGSATFTFGKWKPGALFTSYTSPNDAFGTVQELAGVLAYDDSGSTFPVSPKIVLAQELDGQADGGLKKGTYLELGIRPVIPVVAGGKYPVTVGVPVKLGLGLKDYYEGPTGSNTFGYFDVGAIASVPLAFMNGKTTWEVHGGVDFVFLGDNMKLLNNDDRVKPIGIVGVSVTY
jgi:hypothetical protein